MNCSDSDLVISGFPLKHTTQSFALRLQIEKFVERDLSVIKWFALGAFIIQILSVLLACWLTSVQKAELEAAER